MKISKLVILVALFSIGSLLAQNSVPNGAQFSKQMIKRENIPNSWSSVVGWLQTVTLQPDQSGKTASITIGYMKLYEYDRSTKKSSVIFDKTFNDKGSRQLSDNEGRLFPREPRWYANNAEGDENYIFNSIIRNGYLTIDVSKTPNKIVHWWTPQLDARDNCDYYMEVSAKIEGDVALQIGSDWWQSVGAQWCGDEQCNKLAWVSDWYGDTGGQFITITAPLK